MARVTGIGGVFLRARDPTALKAWYLEHLGIVPTAYGVVKFLASDAVPPDTGVTTWSTFPGDTRYFGEQSQQTMVNYRVDDLAGILARLRTAGATVDDSNTDETFGKFAWAVDPEGNRFELWQPLAG